MRGWGGGGAGCGPGGESLKAGGLRGGEADGAAVFRSRSQPPARFPARRCAGSAAAPRRSAPPLFPAFRGAAPRSSPPIAGRSFAGPRS